MENIERLPVYALLCHRHMEFATGCLASLLHNCRDSIALNIVSDGTLTSADEEVLRGTLPGITIHAAEVSAELARAALRDYSACWRAYMHNPLMRKIVDTSLLAGRRAFGQVDSDVLWVRPFRGLDRRSLDSPCLTYMQDCSSTYCLRFSARYIHPRVALADMVNAGVLFVPAGTVRFEAMESFLSDARLAQIPWYFEQTSWSLLARQVQSRRFEPKQIALPWWVVNRSPSSLPDLVGVHVVSPARHLLPQLAQTWRQQADDATEVRNLRTLPSQCRGIVAAGIERIAQRLRVRRWTRQGLFRHGV
jgi:hypothetical protein